MAVPPLLAAARLRALRQCVGLGEDDPSALLVVGGQDGKHNVASQGILKYLILGDTGRNLTEATIDAGDAVSEALEETVLVIHGASVRLHASGGALPHVTTAASGWGHVQEWLLRVSDLDDAAAAELYKVHAFLAMVRGCKRVLVGLTPDSVDEDDPPSMEVETWPLVQSYGLADFATGGFFTMQKTIVDATPRLGGLWDHLDALTFQQLVLQAVPSLRHHWWTAMQMLDSRTPARRVKLSEAVVGDPLTSLYDFGRLRFRDEAPPDRGATVRFGPRTATKPSDDPFDDATVSESGINGSPALHMVMTAEEPSTGCRVARTYFFRAGLPPMFPGLRPSETSGFLFSFDDEDWRAAGMEPAEMTPPPEPAPPAPPGHQDFTRLCFVYSMVVQALSAAVSVVANAADCDSVVRDATTAATDALAGDALAAALQASNLKDHVEVVVEAMTATGAVVPPGRNALHRPRRMVYIQVCVHRVPSEEVEGATLGSVVAGDTVVPTGIDGEALCLTRTIPYVRCWTADAPGAKVVADITRGLSIRTHRDAKGSLAVGTASSGTLGDAVLLAPPSVDSGYLIGSAIMCSTGMVFQHGARGPLPLSMIRTCSHAWLVDADTLMDAGGLPRPGSDAWATRTSHWVLTGSPEEAFEEEGSSTVRVGPADLASCSALVLAFHDTSPLFAGEYVGLLLPEGTPLKRECVSAIAKWHADLPHPDAPPPPPMAARTLPACLLPGLRSYAASSWMWRLDACAAVEHALHADACLGWGATAPAAPPSLPAAPTDAIPVTLFVGGFGSGAARLASAIVALSSGDNAWQVVGDALSPVTAGSLAVSLAAAVAALQDTPKTRRIALVAPAAAPTPHVAAMVCAAAESVPVVLTAVVACVLMPGTHTDARRSHWAPRLRETCARGFVQHVALTGCDKASEDTLAATRGALHAVNPEAAMLRLGGGLNEAFALSPDAISTLVRGNQFMRPRAVALRQVLCPQWPTLGRAPVPDDPLVVTVRQPLRFAVAEPQFLAWVRHIVEPVVDAAAAALQGGAPTPPGRAYRVRAVVKFTTDASQLRQVDACPGVVQVRDAAPDAVCEVVAVGGPDLTAASVETGAAACRPQVPSQRPLRTADSLTVEELDAIRTRRLGEPLPSSWVFDGTQFMDWSGNVSKFHPHMDTFIHEYLEEANAAVRNYNDMLADLEAAAKAEHGGALDPTEPWWEGLEDTEAPASGGEPSVADRTLAKEYQESKEEAL